eukprot:gene12256-5841_t
MKIVLILAFILLASAQRKQWGVTFPRNRDLPATEGEAIKAKWIKVSTNENCETRYVSPKKDIVNMLIFDKSGGLAGIEVGKYEKPNEPMLSRYYEQKTFEGKTYWGLVSYFVDPKSLCGSRSAGKYGDRVWWVSKRDGDNGFVKLPLTQAEAHKDPKWVLGTCILGMGIHYWYEISADMDCKDFAPFFVMYNSNQLTTIAVGFPEDKHVTTPDSRYEHAPKWVVKRNFLDATFPKCLMKDEVKINTMHMFFTSVFSNRCQKAEALKKIPKNFLKCVQKCLEKKLGPKKWEALLKKCQTNVKCYLKEAGFAGVQCGIQCK